MALISAGPASGAGSEMRAELLRLLPGHKRLDGEFDDACGATVSGPLVLNCRDKPRTARGILNWYRERGVSIADAEVYHFDDKRDEIEAFHRDGHFNARQVSCLPRDHTHGLCGARGSEIVREHGVTFCQ